MGFKHFKMVSVLITYTSEQIVEANMIINNWLINNKQKRASL